MAAMRVAMKSTPDTWPGVVRTSAPAGDSLPDPDGVGRVPAQRHRVGRRLPGRSPRPAALVGTAAWPLRAVVDTLVADLGERIAHAAVSDVVEQSYRDLQGSVHREALPEMTYQLARFRLED